MADFRVQYQQRGKGQGRETVMVEGLDEALKGLQEIIHNIEDLTLIHMDAGMRVRGMQEDHFQQAVNSKGQRWPPLSQLTLDLRRGGGRDARPLLDTGELSSLNMEVSSKSEWALKTIVPYARIQQLGGTVKPKNKRLLAIPVNKLGARSRSSRTATGYVFLKQAKIPAREYMYLTDDEFSDVANYYVEEAITRGVTGLKHGR